MRAPGRSVTGASRGSRHLRFHCAAALLLLSLLAPLVPVSGTAAMAANSSVAQVEQPRAQQSETPPPVPTPSSVIAVGEFQQALGCPDNWDKTCDATALTNNRGLWSGTFVLPAGSYAYRILSVADRALSLGENADPNGGDLNVTVPEGADGGTPVTFSYNTRTGRISATPSTTRISIQTGNGAVELIPNGDGTYEGFFDTSDVAGAQIQVNDQPAGQVDTGNVDTDRLHISLDEQGNAQIEPVAPATLTVTKADADGNPLPGACFAVIADRGLVNQACDDDDGADGTISMTFPNGLAPDTYRLRETSTPDGQSAAAEQQVELAPGENSVEAVAGRAAGRPPAPEEPTAPPAEATAEPAATEPPAAIAPTEPTAAPDASNGINITIQSIAQRTGRQLPGACYILDGQGDGVCDDDGDGNVVFENVERGQHTLTEVAAPEGFLGVADADITVGPRRTEFRVVHQRADSEEPTAPAIEGTAPPAEETTVPPDEATAPPIDDSTATGGVGTLLVHRQDQDGNAMVGACFTLTPRAGTAGEPIGPICDNQDGDIDPTDGDLQLVDIPAGRYRLAETTTPDGSEPARPRNVQIPADDTAELTVDSATTAPATEEPTTGSLILQTRDDQGNALPGICYDVTDADGNAVAAACDGDDGADDGDLTLRDVPAGSFTVAQRAAPDGHEAAQEQNVDVPAGEAPTVSFTNAATPQTGTLRIAATDANGDVQPGVCIRLTRGNDRRDICDNGDGDSDPEDGTITADDLAPGDYSVTETRVPDGSKPAARQKLTVAAGETASLSFASETAPPPPGTLAATLTDEDGNAVAGACLALRGASDLPPVCDNQDGDADPADGAIRLEGIAPGAYTLHQQTVPDGFEQPEDQPVEITSDQVAEAAITNKRTPPPAGKVLITSQDDGGDDLGGACFTLAGAESYGPVCDDGDGDGAEQPGRIQFDDVQVGDYTLTEATTPDGFATPAEQNVTVKADQALRVRIGHARATGSLTIHLRDADGNALPGGCFTLTSDGNEVATVCDNGDGDANDDEAQIEFSGLAPADYTATESTAPDGHDAAEPQPVTITAGRDAELTFTNQATPPPAGSVRLVLSDDQNAPLEGACFKLSGPEDYEACDNGDGDADETAGTTSIENVAPGNYTATETRAPEGHDGATDQALTVTASKTTTLKLKNAPTPPPTGSLEITTIDDAGNQLGGACYVVSGAADAGPICDNGDGDANEVEGVVRFDGLAPGDYSASQTTAAKGYEPGAEQTSAVVAGETRRLRFTNAVTKPKTGALVVIKHDSEGNPLGGACFSLGGPEDQVCDDDERDADNEASRIRFENVPVGSQTVSETTAPDGYQVAKAQKTEVKADEDAELTFIDEKAPVETGTLELRLQAEDQAPVEGGCVLLSADSNSGDAGTKLGPFCDNGDGDQQAEPGVIVVKDLAVGAYSVTPVEADDDGTLQPAADEKTVTVEARTSVKVQIMVANLARANGDVVVIKRDAANKKLLGGACFRLAGARTADLCDNDGNDGDGTPGKIRFDDMPGGSYTLTEVRAPDGYDIAAEQQVTVRRRGLTRVDVKDSKTQVSAGGLIVKKVNDGGDPLPGACFALLDGDKVIGSPVCDRDDGDDDGTINFTGVTAGDYTLRETRVPSADYTLASDRPVTVPAGDTATVEVPNTLKLGQVIIKKVDQAGAPLEGACFALEGGDYKLCDGDVNDLDDAAGVIRFDGVVPGTYAAKETRTPSGYAGAGDQEAKVRPGKSVTLTFINTKLPPPPETGNLTVLKVREDGKPAAGACFSLQQGAATKAGPRCDRDDGKNDGTISFQKVAVGNYRLHETKRPAPGFEPAPDSDVTIALNKTLKVTVKNALKPGRITVFKTDEDGDPLQGACFDLPADNKPPRCTDATGVTTFDGLPQGTYRLVETQAPNGYLRAKDRTGIVVKAGLTTQVEVVDEKAPPPPQTGSIQVIKFFCPAGQAGAHTEIVDSSNPGPSRLAKTANCTKGNASFKLLATSGEGGPGDFATGADGVYQTTLRAGDYRLTETAPDLPGQQEEDVTVFVNQLTTVVVLNFIAPPAPKPASLRVVKFTCDPGFDGTRFADFINNCADSGSLTNNVTFRIAGPTTGRHVTGDIGEAGTTTFRQLTAGSYTLEEEAPNDTVTVYGFCGTDPNAPTIKTVDAAIGLELAAGSATTCTWFNVPEDFSDSTGAILVHKLACDAGTYPANFDWYGECDPFADGADFSLAVLSGQTFVAKSTGTSDEDGLLRFSRLQPGTYQLKETGRQWCHAESNSVNAKGEVIVKAGQRSDVWIFNCVKTKNPPNTGAGTTARAPMTAQLGDVDNVTWLLGLAWPLAGLGLYGLRRRRFAA